ncbi:hypothetical protein [Kitasatospora camelliae]|uniref:Caspase domain-containing protein n=1 Tax=Kitasatospora camelliae TaxID=3156397 RepID=A0AAU8K135_9ACTN
MTAASGDGVRPDPVDETAELPLIGADAASGGPAAGRLAVADPFALPPSTTPSHGTPVPADPFELPPTAVPSTGWTATIPAITLPPTAPPTPQNPPTAAAPPQPVAPAPAPVPAPAPAVAPTAVTPPAAVTAPAGQSGGIGGSLRGRILVIEGGYGARRHWGRGGAAQAPVLSAMLAAVSPQILLAADAVDAVHLPGATDPQTVLAHLRAAARHPGPLLIHVGGHLFADRRGGQIFLTLRDSKPADSLPWQALANELSQRPADLDTLVIGDLSGDHAAWPQLQSAITPLVDGVPLWAAITPDPDQVGTFTRALIEVLHRGRPGADAVLTPEQLRQQVHSVLRPDVITLTAHAADRPLFRNTSRQIGPGAGDPQPQGGPVPAAVAPKPAGRAARPAVTPAAAPRPVPTAGDPQATVGAPAAAPAAPARGGLQRNWQPRGMVSLRKPGVPATPPRPARPVALEKSARSDRVDLGKPTGTEKVELGKPSGTEKVELGKPTADRVELGKEASAERVETGKPTTERVELGKPAAPEQPDAAERVELGKPSTATPDSTDRVELAKPAARPEPVEPEAVGAAERVELGKPTAAVQTAPAASESAATEPEADPLEGYRDAIGRIVASADAGAHQEAAELAIALEEKAVAVHGPVAPAVLQVRQVRAHVSRLAGRAALAAEIYREVALTLLRTEGPEHTETQRAATNAEACWRAVKDPAEAISIAPDIIELRAHLPGPDGRKLRAAERHLRQLVAAKAAHDYAEPTPTA